MDYKIVKSFIFTHYNRAKYSGAFEEGRLNRALGLALSKNYSKKRKEYGTNYRQCWCPDFEYRTAWCKHRIAFWILRYTWFDIQEHIEKEMLWGLKP